MTNLFDSNVNQKFMADTRWFGKSYYLRWLKRARYLELEVAKIVADEYQHNWLVCHELRLFGG